MVNNVQSLVDRLRSVLEVYYDWVQITPAQDHLSIRVGKKSPTDRDLDEFMLRVNGEVHDGEGVTDVQVKPEEGEIVASLSLQAFTPDGASSDDLFKAVQQQSEVPTDVQEDDRLDLSKFWSVSGRSIRASFFCEGMESAKTKLGLVRKFLESHGFKLIEEGNFEDTFVSHRGALARISLFKSIGVQPTLQMFVFVPKTVEEANLVRKSFGLNEIEILPRETAKEADKVWGELPYESRVDILMKNVPLTVERARHWARFNFTELMDLHPFMAQGLAKGLVEVKI